MYFTNKGTNIRSVLKYEPKNHDNIQIIWTPGMTLLMSNTEHGQCTNMTHACTKAPHKREIVLFKFQINNTSFPYYCSTTWKLHAYIYRYIHKTRQLTGTLTHFRKTSGLFWLKTCRNAPSWEWDMKTQTLISRILPASQRPISVIFCSWRFLFTVYTYPHLFLPAKLSLYTSQ